MVIPRSFSSGALSIESKERSSERPFFARTVVIAAVRVVLPWSTCPIVPMFTCGLDLSNFSFAISVIYFRNNCPSISLSRRPHPSTAGPFPEPGNRRCSMSGRRGSNPRPLAWKANALPTELLPQFSFLRRAPLPSFRKEATARRTVWAEMDSNHRSRKTADLQSAPFGHSGIRPILEFQELVSADSFRPLSRPGKTSSPPSRWRDSNPRPADYKSAALAN